jgi:hypothetical protein
MYSDACLSSLNEYFQDEMRAEYRIIYLSNDYECYRRRENVKKLPVLKCIGIQERDEGAGDDFPIALGPRRLMVSGF